MKPAFALALFALLATSVFAQTTESKSKQESRQIIGAGSAASDIEQSKKSPAPQQEVPESPQQIQLRPSAMSSGDLPARTAFGASVDDANAQMRSELEQLKLLVQRQEARIAALEQQQPAVRQACEMASLDRPEDGPCFAVVDLAWLAQHQPPAVGRPRQACDGR